MGVPLSKIGKTALNIGTFGLAGLGIKAAAKALTPPKPPAPPKPPQLTSLFNRPLIGAQEGTLGGTFLGSNRAPQVSGGKKTLLGG